MTLVQLVRGVSGSNLGGATLRVAESRQDERAGRPNMGCQPRTNSTSVRLSPSTCQAGGACEVIQQLLHNGREFEYRIKSANEEHRPVEKAS
jgi:hypothetical protein